MTNIVNTELGAVGRFINFGADPAGNDSIAAQTVMVYAKPTGAGGGNFAYLWAKTGAAAATGPRFYIDHNAGSPKLVFASHSSGAAGFPARHSTGGDVTYDAWHHFTATWTGSGVLASNIKLYIDGVEPTYSITTDGSTTLANDTANEMFLLNRAGEANLGREFIGSIAMVARWNRVLDATERATARTTGPLAVPSGLTLCFANGQDYSPNALIPTNRTTHVDGELPPILTLGDSVEPTPSTPDPVLGAGALPPRRQRYYIRLRDRLMWFGSEAEAAAYMRTRKSGRPAKG